MAQDAQETRQAVTLASQHMNTAIQFLFRVEDIAAALLTLNPSPETNEITDWVEKEHGTVKYDISIPRDKVMDFYNLANQKGMHIPFETIDPNKGRSEYVNVMYRGPVYAMDSDGRPVLDEKGNQVIVAGTDNDMNMLQKFSTQVTKEYLKEKRLEITSDLRLSTTEANANWNGKMTDKVIDLTLNQARLMQDRANEIGVESFMRLEENGKFSVEFNHDDMVRDLSNPEAMSGVEKVIHDYRIEMATPQIQDYVDSMDTRHEVVSSVIAGARNGEVNPDIVLVKLDGISHEERPYRCVITDNRAEFYREGEKSPYLNLDLTKDKQYGEFVEEMKYMGDHSFVDRDTFDRIYSDHDVELFKSEIESELDIRDNYLEAKEDILAAAEYVRDSHRTTLAIVNDPEKTGYQMVEQRIPESDTIIADTVKTFSDKLDAEQIRHNLNVADADLHIAEASYYISTPSYAKQNTHEVLMDDRSYDARMVLNGNEPSSATPAEEKRYAEAVNEINMEQADQMDVYNEFIAEVEEEIEETSRELEEEVGETSNELDEKIAENEWEDEEVELDGEPADLDEIGDMEFDHDYDWQ